MRRPRVSTDIVPVSEFKAQAATWLERLSQTRQPVVITQNGKPAGVLMSPAAFDELTERSIFIAAVEEGLADSEAGRLIPHAEVVAKLIRRQPRRRARER